MSFNSCQIYGIPLSTSVEDFCDFRLVSCVEKSMKLICDSRHHTSKKLCSALKTLTCVVRLPFRKINKQASSYPQEKFQDKIRRLFQIKQEINFSSVSLTRVCGCEILQPREIYLLISHDKFNCCFTASEEVRK